VDIVDRHQTSELGLDLLDHRGCAGGDDGDAREVAQLVGLGHGQALDIVAAPGEQADDAGQHTGFVVDQNAEGVALRNIRVGVAQVIGRVAGRAGL
jgi:hypothetical protein